MLDMYESKVFEGLKERMKKLDTDSCMIFFNCKIEIRSEYFLRNSWTFFFYLEKNP